MIDGETVGSGCSRRAASFLAAVACLGVGVLAAPGVAHAAPLPASQYDSGDGDQADGLNLDWQSAASSGTAITNADPNGADNCFVGGKKENTPNQWAFNTSAGGCVPGKSNVRAAWANAESVGSTTFSHFAFWRNDTTGNSFLTFELNQSTATWTNAAGTTIPCRQNGDLVLAFEVGGSSLVTTVYKWTGDGTGPGACPNGANGSFSSSGSVAGGNFQGNMNASSAITNYLSPLTYGSTFPANSFGETAINLPAVLQGMGQSPCFGFLQMQVHTRSSSSVSSALIDYTSPTPVYLQSCSATGYKYLDNNGNGLRDSGEPGLSGFTFYADINDNGTKDSGEPSGTSDSNGFYRILNVPAGTYKIREVDQAGWECSQPSPCYYSRSFTSGGNSTGNDFGNTGPSIVSGTKFDDLDGDGALDAGEPGRSGFTFYVDYDGDGTKDAGEPEGTSDGTGAWTIANVKAGTYKIREVAQGGWTCSYPSPCEYTRTFTSGSSQTGLTFGNKAAAGITGNFFEDMNGDGAAKAGGDVNLTGWQAYIDANSNDSFDTGETQATTDASGNYSFTGLDPGTYTVRATLLSASWYCTTPSQTVSACERQITLTSGQSSSGNDFGFTRFATVSGSKFDDANSNAIKDSGEAGLSGWVFYVDYDNDDSLDAGEPQATSAATTGAWTITGVKAGSYPVREIAQGGWTCTQPASTCRYELTIASNASLTGSEFGNVASRTASGTVFRDSNANGAKDAGEPGLSGWTAYHDASKNGALDAGEAAAVTNSEGLFQIFAPGNGKQQIRVVVQSGWTCSFPVTTCMHEVQFTGNSGSIANNDFGVWGTSSISGNVFEDLDADGAAKEVGEPNLSGRTVYVDSNSNSALDAGEPQTTTAASGDYTISGINPGTYTLRTVTPGGWTCSRPSPCSYSVSIDSANVTGRDFGSHSTGTIAGNVFQDLDADGAAKESGEGNLSGRTVYLDSNNNGTLDGGEPSTTSNGSGDYSFARAPGSYVVRQVLPGGWTGSLPSGGSYSVTVTSQSSATARDFASYTTGSISGTLFQDTDFDGSASELGDLPLTGRTVYLDANDNGSLDGGETSTTTGVSGTYSFTGLAPAMYKVRQVLPAGWAGPYPDPNVYTVTATSGSTTSGRDFGSYIGASVSGNVFEDLDDDGLAKELGESGLSGQRVYLDGDNDGVRDADEPTTLTDVLGNFAFTGIEVQSWHLRLDLDSGWTCDRPLPCNYPLTLTSAAVETGKDFGAHSTGSISGHLYTDRDNDQAAQEFGENDQPSRTVYVDANDNGQQDVGETSTTTDDNGNYTLSGLQPGTYRVRQILPGGWTCSAPSPCNWSVTITSRQAATGKDFSSWTTASFSGKHFEDLDGDGAFPEDGEPGISGRTVYVDLDNDSTKDAGEPEASTGGGGTYSFTSLAPGAYVVRSSAPPAGWTCAYPSPCSWSIILEASESAQEIDFGSWTTGTVSGQKFEDLDKDGVKDGGESGLSGWTIYADLDDDSVKDVGEPSATTDGSGNYSIALDPRANAKIREVSQSGWTCSTPGSCVHTVTVESQGAYTGRDFGNWRQGTVAGQKFNDLDGDGVKDGGESGLSGWTIYADLDDDSVKDIGEPSATTDGSGNYSLGLDPGSTYKIREVGQAGWTCSTPSPCSYPVAVSSSGSYTGRDFGNWQDSTASGTKFNDADNDGVKDGGESGLSGWTFYVDYDGDATKDAGEPEGTSVAGGAWSIGAIKPGAYKVREVGQAGWACTKPSPCYYDETFTSGSSRSSREFGNTNAASLSGTVFEDLDKDGVKEGGESGLAGETVYLDLDDDGTKDVGEPEQTTAGDGSYLFNTTSGTHVVRAVTTGWTCSLPSGCRYSRTLSVGDSSTGNDFGLWAQGAVSGQKFEDLDADGVKDGGESGLGGWTIYVDLNDNGSRNDGEPQATTDGSGNYAFDLDPGTYKIREVSQAGWTCSTPGSCVHTVTVSSSGSYTGRDFGNWRPASVSGQVFDDVDGDGTKDVGDSGLSGWTVYHDADTDGTRDVGETSTTTDGSGNYTLNGFTPGARRVRVELEDDWSCSGPATCLLDVSLTSGQAATGRDFGVTESAIPPASVSGQVFADSDADGVKDSGETGLEVLRVFVDADGDDAYDSGEIEDLTDASGNYSLSGIEPGSRVVRVVLGSRFCSAPGSSASACEHSLSLVSGQSATGKDFGVYERGTVSGQKFSDLDADGTKDSGESGLSGWTVYVDLDDDAARDAGEPEATTNGSGNYSFDLNPGSYKIREVGQAGWTCSTPSPCAHTVTVLSSGTYGGRDFGGWRHASVSGQVFDDSDADGLKDAGESGLSGWTVYHDADNDGTRDVGETSTTTDGSGNYTLNGFTPGTRRIRVELESGWSCSGPATCLHDVALTSDQAAAGRDFGAHEAASPPGVISGVIFDDRDADGARGTSEPALGGWTVYLDLNGNGGRDAGEPEAVTDSAGGYRFPNLLPGSYRLMVVTQSGWACSPTSACPTQISVSSGQEASKSIGAVKPGALAGLVYYDQNADSARNAGEPPLGDWTVFIDSNGNKRRDAGEPTATTDAAGRYRFTGLAPGRYTVATVPPPNWGCGIPMPCRETVTVLGNTDTEVLEFGAWTPPATLAGTVHLDLDVNGRVGPLEPGMVDWTVYVDLNDNQQFDEEEPHTLTGDETGARRSRSTRALVGGGYFIGGIPPGNYTVRIQRKTGWDCSYPLSCVYPRVNFVGGEDVIAKDFGVADEESVAAAHTETVTGTDPASEDCGRPINGTAGNDEMVGWEGGQRYFGRKGSDVLKGLTGPDCLGGGFQDDRVIGGPGEDFGLGGPGPDVAEGGAAADLLRAGRGSDLVFGDAGADRLGGGRSGDRIRGGRGGDRITGGYGDDRVDGQQDRDVVRGGDGRDLVKGGKGTDVLRGGPGQDRVVDPLDDGDEIDCGPGPHDLAIVGPSDLTTRCERVIVRT